MQMKIKSSFASWSWIPPAQLLGQPLSREAWSCVEAAFQQLKTIGPRCPFAEELGCDGNLEFCGSLGSKSLRILPA